MTDWSIIYGFKKDIFRIKKYCQRKDDGKIFSCYGRTPADFPDVIRMQHAHLHDTHRPFHYKQDNLFHLQYYPDTAVLYICVDVDEDEDLLRRHAANYH